MDGSLKIPKGSFLEIKSRGILGDVFIEIVRNQGETSFMASGEFMPRNPESNDIEALMTNLNNIARDIKKITGSLSNVLGTKEGETSVKNILDNIEGVTADLRDLS